MPLKYPYLVFAYIPLAILIIIIMSKSFVKFGKKEERLEFRRRTRGIRLFIIISRLIIFFCLIIALASPFMVEQKETKGDPSLTILEDSSISFNLFDKTITSTLEDQIKKEIKVKTVNIASGNRSALGDGVLNNLKGDDSLLLVTDGYTNAGKDINDVVMLVTNMNSTINAINLKPVNEDTVVTIDAPRSTIVGSEVEFVVNVEQAGAEKEYRLIVEVDGDEVASESAKGSKTFDFSKKLSEGYHRIKATIKLSDFFRQNNMYYKTIQVIPKPKLLFVSEGNSPLTERLDQLYAVTKSENIKDLETYSVVVLNDIPVSQIPDSNVEKLTDFVTDGGGLVVIGGEDSYDLGGY